MSIRRDVADALGALFAYGTVKSPRKAPNHTVNLDVSGDAGQVVPDCDAWGDAALLHHPLPGAETLSLDLADETVVIGTRDRRWQIETSPGETVVRAVGAGSPAFIRLKPDGTCEVVATAVKLTSPTATQPYVRGTALHTYLDAVVNALKTAITSAGPGGPAAVTTLNATLAGLAALKTATTSTKITGD